MAIKDLDLKTLLDIPLWEKVQDELAKLTGTAVITIDFKGNPITKHSCRTDFSERDKGESNFT
ncbi:MAG: PocR ligand-binding domain-containing protein [Oscillospiraceae bacterium]